ncbi:TPA: aldo/keto reductase [Vibrio alginolyticus]
MTQWDWKFTMESEAVKTLVDVIKKGTMIETADAYGASHKEGLIKEALEQIDEKVFIATKSGIVFDEKQKRSTLETGRGTSLIINGTREYVTYAINNSLDRLGVQSIDLLYAHYLDPRVPLEETVSAMADAVKAGQVKAIGLSNVTVDQILKAHEIHPISAVQYEYSLFCREAELNILPVVRQIGAFLVCCSPLGAGFLTDKLRELAQDDFRNKKTKTQGENFKSNLQRLEDIKNLAEGYNITSEQLALVWLVAQGDNIIPISGSRIIENLEVLNITLSKETLARLDEIAPIGAFKGETLV